MQCKVIECPKGFVGCILGKKGKNLKALERSSGANIQIDDTQDPTDITITGHDLAVDIAEHLVTGVIINGGKNWKRSPLAEGAGLKGQKKGLEGFHGALLLSLAQIIALPLSGGLASPAQIAQCVKSISRIHISAS